MIRYDYENNCYDRLIKKEDVKPAIEKMKKLLNRIRELEIFDDLPILHTVNLDFDDTIQIDEFMDINGFTPNISYNRLGECIFLSACFFSSKKEIIKWLVEFKGAEINRTDILGNNALIHIIINENMKLEDKLEIIQYLIEMGADIHLMAFNGRTALNVALETMQTEIAHLLLDNGARIFKNISVYDLLKQKTSLTKASFS